MAKSLNSRCDFENGFFTCDFPEDALLLILKVKTQTGNHRLAEDKEIGFKGYTLTPHYKENTSSLFK